jgi:hypothetical protein
MNHAAYVSTPSSSATPIAKALKNTNNGREGKGNATLIQRSQRFQKEKESKANMTAFDQEI